VGSPHGARAWLILGLSFVLALFTRGSIAVAQQAPSAPPVVGVIAVVRQPIARSTEYMGRIKATDRVNLVARVSAYLDERLFTEGMEVKKGDLLYRLEQAPFQADVQAKQSAVEQFKAQLQNAEVMLSRAEALLQTHAGPQSTVDAALANAQALRAQVLGAEAQLQQSRISLSYTEICAPIDGKISRTAITSGNYVGANTGVLTSVVSQDPMYVVFPVSMRDVIDLRRRSAGASGDVVIKIRLPDGRLYDQVGKLDFLDNPVAGNTDTVILRGAVPNPALSTHAGQNTRELIDGELVTVLLEDAHPIEALTIPRVAVLTDQSGDYVYAVGPDRKVQQRRVLLGQSSPGTVIVTNGLSEGENIITEGIQRARPGQFVSPGPVSDQVRPSALEGPGDDISSGHGTHARRG
jgi:membrane fusion protein (multidrug efflux system)